MNRTLGTFLLLSLFVSSHCSHCVEETINDLRSPGDSIRSVLKVRRCGTAEGWAVVLSGKGLAEQEVSTAKMPPPTSVVDVKNGVSIRWSCPSTLLISAPTWVKPMRMDKRYESVTIRYEANRVAYPRG